MGFDDDPVAHAATLSEVYETALGEGRLSEGPRPIISQSWRRSLAAHIDPERRTPPVVYSPAETRRLREDHPLNAVIPLLRDTLVSIADDAMHLVLVTDAEGLVLWRDGATRLLADADRVGLQPGTRWSESAIGTNAMGTTLAVDAPVRIHSAEHLVRTYHAWTCVAAPVHDPDTGAILGAIDISGPLHTMHPALVKLVAATARLAENQLRVQLAIADERLRVRNMPHLASLRGQAGALVTRGGRLLAAEPYGAWPDRVEIGVGAERVLLPDGRQLLVEPLAEGYLLRAVPTGGAARAVPTALTLRVLGAGPPTLLLNGRTIPLTLRLAEVLTVLTVHPGGLSGEQLTTMLYGDGGNQATVRGEIHRLRGLIGSQVLRTRPYRLAATVDSDVGTVRAALRAGHTDDALRGCAGPLLPLSDSPEVSQLREELAAGLRGAVLGSLDAELLYAFTGNPLGRDDLAAHEQLITLLDHGDPRRAPAHTRLDLLRRDEPGSPTGWPG